MSAINPNALSKFVGQLYVAPYADPTSLVRIASVRELTTNFDTTANQVEINADDTGTVFKGYRPDGKVEGSFLENFDRDLMVLLLGGTPTTVAGSIVNNFSQVVPAGWAYNKFIPLLHQNGDGSAPNLDSVTGSVDGLLVAETDYFFGTNSEGVYGIFVKNSVTVTTLVQTITIQYDYTPNASESLSIPLSFTESKRLYLKIVAQDLTGKLRTIILPDCTFDATYSLEFLDLVEAGDLAGTTFTFNGNKGSTVEIYNEIL